MIEPEVDVVIAVHTASRPIDRAVRSVLDNSAALRVSVVCHNIPASAIAANLGALVEDPRVRLLEFTDDTRSPTGPFNHGLDSATAEFTSVLGSDDELEPGAVDSWLAMARAHGADVVIPRLVMASGAPVSTPPTRPLRSARLDGARDRLAYRTAQLGLVSRRVFPELRFTPSLTTGEDIAYGLRLWFSAASISFDRRGPGYVIHDEGDDRTSASLKPVEDDFAFLDAALDPDWIAGLSGRDREAIAAKLLRTHVMEAMRARLVDAVADPEELAALAHVVGRIAAIAPRVLRVLSVRDSRILEAVAGGTAGNAVRRDLVRRTQYWRPGSVVSASPLLSLHREAPARFLFAIARTR